jgi:hypothetical protein
MKRFNDFDPPRAQTLLAYIRQGGFPTVAADAAGVPPPIFASWLRRSEQRGVREPLRSFAKSVRQAIAQARLLSELAVCKHDPKFWLSHGPGKETADHAGWTTPVRPRVRAEVREDPIETRRAFCSWILEALTPYPEARAKLAELVLANPPPCPDDNQRGSHSAREGHSAGTSLFLGGLDPSLN